MAVPSVETFRSGQDTCHRADRASSRTRWGAQRLSALILTVLLRTLDRAVVARTPASTPRYAFTLHSMPSAARVAFGSRKGMQEFLTQAAVLYLLLAIMLPYVSIRGYRAGAPLPENTRLLCNALLVQAIALLTLVALLNPSPRGPYFQFIKCTSFFTTALSYPDRWFRHVFRYV